MRVGKKMKMARGWCQVWLLTAAHELLDSILKLLLEGRILKILAEVLNPLLHGRILNILRDVLNPFLQLLLHVGILQLTKSILYTFLELLGHLRILILLPILAHILPVLILLQILLGPLNACLLRLLLLEGRLIRYKDRSRFHGHLRLGFRCDGCGRLHDAWLFRQSFFTKKITGYRPSDGGHQRQYRHHEGSVDEQTLGFVI
jgi:hypothetical protein